MAIQLTQNPNTHNFGYGVNAVTLSGIATTNPVGNKYVLQIRAADGTTVLATLRQSKNILSVAQFDIQNVLQSYIGTPQTDIDKLGVTGDILATSTNEVYEYQLWYGSESNGVLIDPPGLVQSGPYQVVAGTKEYYQILGADIIDDNTYRLRPIIEAEGGAFPCYTVSDEGNPLSNVRRSYSLQSNPYAYPDTDNSWDTVEKVWVEEARRDERLTKSWWNQMTMDQGAPSPANHIGAFQIVVYDGDTQIQDEFIPNILVNGGGPNQSISDTTTGSGESLIITMGIGPANIEDFGYNNGFAADQFQLQGDWTHYYITPVASQAGQCGSGVNPGQLGEPTHNPTLVIRKEENCSDFDPIRFSWVNEYGFMDYYSFDKKNVKTVNTKRNTYLKESNDYNSNLFTVDRGSRGTTTYSQKSEETYEANTGYMTDAEAEYLQYLFRSADVRAQSNRFKTEEYLPVVLTDVRWTQKTNRTDQLFQYTVKFKLAHNIKTQRG